MHLQGNVRVIILENGRFQSINPLVGVTQNAIFNYLLFSQCQ